MESEKKLLCRFCFKSLEDANYQTISEIIGNFLSTLLLKPNLDITEKPSVCCDCVEDLQKAFEFKSMFIYSSKFLLSSGNVERGSKYILGEHFLLPNDETNLICSSDEELTCQTCAKFVTIDCVSSTYELREFVAISKDVLERHLPELDLTTPDKTVICPTCFASLKHCVSTIERCTDAEDRVIKHNLSEHINKFVDVTLKIVEKTRAEDDAFEIKEIKKEIEAETFNLEGSALEPETKVKTELWNLENSQPPREILWLKNEAVYDSSTTETLTYSYQTDDNDVLTAHTEQHNNLPNDLDSTDLKRFQCDLCDYKTKRKAHLKSHLESHRRKLQRQMFKCNLCIFQARYKSMLRKHMVVHTDPSQLRMFMCQICSYQTKYKGSLTGHMQKHNEEGYKCEVCSFETKYRKNLERHMMTHKDPAEIPKYKCAMCDFEAKRKSHLSVHITVKHRGASDVTKYRCEECGFEFVSKSDFNRHSKTVHKDPSEIPMYSCPECSFQTKYKDHLPRHMIVHKDVSEVVTYKCEFCPFQTKYENGIKGHLLLHSDSSQHPVFRCEACDFVTNRRQYLSKHRNMHKNNVAL